MRSAALAALVVTLSSLARADEAVRIEWKDVRPGDQLIVRVLGGREARGTLRYRISGSDGESFMLDDLTLRRTEVTAIFRFSPAPPIATPPAPTPPAPMPTPESPSPPPSDSTPPMIPAANPHPVHVFEDPPPRRVALGVDAGAALHSFVGVPIWGGFFALTVGGILEPVTLAFRSNFFLGNTADQLGYFQLEGGFLVETRIRRLHVGVEPFVGFLEVSRATRVTSSVTGPLVGLAFSVGADLAMVGRGSVRIDLTGKVASAGEAADTWEVAFGIGCRFGI